MYVYPFSTLEKWICCAAAVLVLMAVAAAISWLTAIAP